jgi:hypothetical protein
MHTRVASGPPGDPVGLKAAILSDPSIVEKGFRILDADLRAGSAGAIDLVGLDRAGALVLIAISANDPGNSLLRLLDQYLWIIEQRQLLERIYFASGPAPSLPVRCLLLAPGFTHAFLRRLSMLSVDVSPYLARRAPARNGPWLVEPAAPLFGYGLAESSAEADVPSPAIPEATGDAAERPSLIAFEDAPPRMDSLAAVPEPARESEALPGTPPASEALHGLTSAGEGLHGLPPASESLPGLPVISEAEPGEPFETLTADELEEFERFDRQRREGQRRSP